MKGEASGRAIWSSRGMTIPIGDIRSRLQVDLMHGFKDFNLHVVIAELQLYHSTL